MFECDGEQLVGMLHPATNGAVCGVLIVVGGPQYRVGSHRQFVLTARALARQGFPVLRFDYRGMGDSTGDYRGFEGVSDDIAAAVEAFVRAAPHVEKIVLFGLCDAASAALLYCGQDARICSLILLNPWVRTAVGEADSYVRHYYGRRLFQASFWRKALSGKLQVVPSVVDFLRKANRALSHRVAGGSADSTPFIDRMLRGLQQFDRAVLIVMSGRDLTAQEFRSLCDSSAPWKRAISRDNVTVVEMEKADHTFSSSGSHSQLLVALLRWLGESGASTREPRSRSEVEALTMVGQ